MRKTLWIIGLAMAVPAVASAQAVPRVEVFGAYSYAAVEGYNDGEIDPDAGNTPFPTFGSHGWTGSVAVNATRWLGVVAEVSGLDTSLTRSITAEEITLTTRERSYLFGPQFTYRSGRWAFFAHALYGESHASVMTTAPEVLIPAGFVETKAAMGMGGGIDLTVYSRRHGATGAGQQLGIRPAQVDWLRTSFTGGHQYVIRLSAGLVFRF